MLYVWLVPAQTVSNPEIDAGAEGTGVTVSVMVLLCAVAAETQLAELVITAYTWSPLDQLLAV
jgi:hypothetical protein